MHPQAEQEVKFVRNFFAGGELEGGSDKFSSFGLCIEDDDDKGQIVEEKSAPLPQRKSSQRLCVIL